MRLRFWFATAAVMSFASSAEAASTDLVFCSKLSDKTERIHCYDAAARIAATKPRAAAAQAPSPAPAIVSAPAQAAYASKAPWAPEQRSRFHGAYAALGGSYGLASRRSGSTTFVEPPFTSAGHLVHPDGPSLIATAGYNYVFDRWLVGAEIAGRWGSERASASDTTNVIARVDAPIFELTIPVTHTYKTNNDAGVHLSGRVGAVFADTLVFGKVGIGAAHFVETFTYSDQFQSATAKGSFWAPSVIVGGGIEQNFGRAFARLSAEIEAIYADQRRAGTAPFTATSLTDGTSWTARGSGAVGVRF